VIDEELGFYASVLGAVGGVVDFLEGANTDASGVVVVGCPFNVAFFAGGTLRDRDNGGFPTLKPTPCFSTRAKNQQILTIPPGHVTLSIPQKRDRQTNPTILWPPQIACLVVKTGKTGKGFPLNRFYLLGPVILIASAEPNLTSVNDVRREEHPRGKSVTCPVQLQSHSVVWMRVVVQSLKTRRAEPSQDVRATGTPRCPESLLA